MFAANRSRCPLPLFSARNSLRSTFARRLRVARRSTVERSVSALGLLLSSFLPACSANRFDSTDNFDSTDKAAFSDDVTVDAGHDASLGVGKTTRPDATTEAGVETATQTMPNSARTAPASSEDATSQEATSSAVSSVASTRSASSFDPSSARVSSAESSSESWPPTQTASTAAAEPSTSDQVTDPRSSRPLSDTSSFLRGETFESSGATTTIDGETSRASSAVADAGADASLDGSSSEAPAEPDASATDPSNSGDTSKTEPERDSATSNTPTSTTNEATAPPVLCTATRSLPGVVRDFSEDHVDMEPCEDVDCRSEKGVVEVDLGADGKPVLSDNRGAESTIHDSASFNQWFNDVEGINTPVPFALRITTQRYLPPRKIGFDSANPPPDSPAGFGTNPKGFFPIDELNQTTRPHNYSFTYEVTSFIEYTGGETLTIRGDDDIFVFIDRKLVIDLGGIHLPEEATVNLDDLGLDPGGVYDFRLFFAERHVEQSNLYLSTTARFMECTGL